MEQRVTGEPAEGASVAAALPAQDGHWLNPERIRVYSTMLLVIFAVVFGVWIARALPGLVDARGKPIGYDFMAFWSAARLLPSRSSSPGLQHLEHQAEVVEQAEELGDLPGVALHAHQTARDRVRERQLAKDDPVQDGALERHGRVGGVARPVGQVGERAVLEVHHVGPREVLEHRALGSKSFRAHCGSNRETDSRQT